MNGFDPQAPLIGPDGLEYACFADFLVGEAFDSWRNREIRRRREDGQGEQAVRAWIEAWDGSDYRACETAGRGDTSRRVRASIAARSITGAYDLF
jgi:hypothetical protein